MKELTKQERQMIHQAASLLGRIGGRIGGKAKTPAKQKASRENAKLGGRPRKPWAELSKAGRYARRRREQAKRGGK